MVQGAIGKLRVGVVKTCNLSIRSLYVDVSTSISYLLGESPMQLFWRPAVDLKLFPAHVGSDVEGLDLLQPVS